MVLLNGCGSAEPGAIMTDAPDKNAALRGKADGSDICAILELEPDCDICDHFGWYGDSFCDQVLIDVGLCKGPDPDCAPVERAEPDWMGNVLLQITRATSTPCGRDSMPMNESFTYDSWARQRATARNVCFEIYEPGVTDFDNADMWRDLDVQVHYRFGDGEFQTQYVNIVGRVGNNAQYALPLYPFDPFALGGPDAPYEEIDSTRVATLQLYFTVNSVELRPDSADSLFTGTFTAPAFGY